MNRVKAVPQNPNPDQESDRPDWMRNVFGGLRPSFVVVSVFVGATAMELSGLRWFPNVLWPDWHSFHFQMLYQLPIRWWLGFLIAGCVVWAVALRENLYVANREISFFDPIRGGMHFRHVFFSALSECLLLRVIPYVFLLWLFEVTSSFSVTLQVCIMLAGYLVVGYQAAQWTLAFTLGGDKIEGHRLAIGLLSFWVLVISGNVMAAILVEIASADTVVFSHHQTLDYDRELDETLDAPVCSNA